MVNMLGNIGVALVALLHFWFFVLETFLWQKPTGRKVFKLDPEFAQRSAPLATNQGLYNLFLSAGLIWSLFVNDPMQALQLKIFFLSCVIIAGIYGAKTVNFRIFIVQAAPAILTLLVLLFSISF